MYVVSLTLRAASCSYSQIPGVSLGGGGLRNKTPRHLSPVHDSQDTPSPTKPDSDIVGEDGPAADLTTRSSTSRHPSPYHHSTGTPDTTNTAEFFWDEENDEPDTATCDTDTASPSFLRKSNTFTPNTGRDSALDKFILLKLHSDPINGHIKEICNTIDKVVRDREIDAETGKALLVPHPMPGRFYILPKIHKEGNPGRPIISGNGSTTEIISQFVDFHMVIQLPSYVQDDMDFLRKIEEINALGPLSPDTILCTMDVSALYTNIPHEEGIDACRAALREGKEVGTTPSPSFLCDLIQLILTLNTFTFMDNTYIQIHGTAMGTCMAPTYANLFMGALESQLVHSFEQEPLVWLRYSYDTFLIWTHGRASLDAFLRHANLVHRSIKFTSHISPIQIPFLDVMVTLHNNTLHTDLYSKPTDTFNYLHWTSCHPHHTKRSIPYSLAFRL
ncbi:hypothetical protein EGW08_021381, partial [Elysia chlorotica]